MSTLKHVILQEKDQDNERKLDWSYIEWVENEVVTTGVANAQTQTDQWPFEHKECQTSNPVIMHIDLTRTHSKLRHSALVDTDGLGPPFFQFDRQAPGRISTSPTLRRMRSTRRSVMDTWDAVRMGSTQEEPSSESTSSSISPQSPSHRVKSPLAASPLSDGENSQDYQPISSSGRQRTRFFRSKTLDNGVASKRQESRSALPALSKKFGFPDSDKQVSLTTSLCNFNGKVCSPKPPSKSFPIITTCRVLWPGVDFLSLNEMVTHSFLHSALPPAVVTDNVSF